ncbi:hypothetical protein, partial [Leptospirillum ferriphilum]|uniref:hypothetical protein n=1 Tax=Leptospirillum ferriphilum TaxID=178606 RepID=UPI00193943CC
GTPFLTPQNKALSRGVRWFTRTSPQMVERVPGQASSLPGQPCDHFQERLPYSAMRTSPRLELF